jgi:hypothetical protein
METERDILSERKNLILQNRILKKRDRLIKNGWRNGIAGIEIPGEDIDSIFFKESKLNPLPSKK